MHLFNKDAEIPLAKQLSNRLAGTAIGELLGQRFEQLESPEYHPQQLGAASAFIPEGGSAPVYYCGPPPATMPYTIPASEAAEELAIDNVILGAWLGVLPALVRATSRHTRSQPHPSYRCSLKR